MLSTRCICSLSSWAVKWWSESRALLYVRPMSLNISLASLGYITNMKYLMPVLMFFILIMFSGMMMMESPDLSSVSWLLMEMVISPLVM